MSRTSHPSRQGHWLVVLGLVLTLLFPTACATATTASLIRKQLQQQQQQTKLNLRHEKKELPVAASSLNKRFTDSTTTTKRRTLTEDQITDKKNGINPASSPTATPAPAPASIEEEEIPLTPFSIAYSTTSSISEPLAPMSPTEIQLVAIATNSILQRWLLFDVDKMKEHENVATLSNVVTVTTGNELLREEMDVTTTTTLIQYQSTAHYNHEIYNETLLLLLKEELDQALCHRLLATTGTTYPDELRTSLSSSSSNNHHALFASNRTTTIQLWDSVGPKTSCDASSSATNNNSNDNYSDDDDMWPSFLSLELALAVAVGCTLLLIALSILVWFRARLKQLLIEEEQEKQTQRSLPLSAEEEQEDGDIDREEFLKDDEAEDFEEEPAQTEDAGEEFRSHKGAIRIKDPMSDTPQQRRAVSWKAEEESLVVMDGGGLVIYAPRPTKGGQKKSTQPQAQRQRTSLRTPKDAATLSPPASYRNILEVPQPHPQQQPPLQPQDTRGEARIENDAKTYHHPQQQYPGVDNNIDKQDFEGELSSMQNLAGDDNGDSRDYDEPDHHPLEPTANHTSNGSDDDDILSDELPLSDAAMFSDDDENDTHQQQPQDQDKENDEDFVDIVYYTNEEGRELYEC